MIETTAGVKHIIVPVDPENTAVAEKAMAQAAEIAKASGAAISILSVVPVWREDLGEEPPEMRAQMGAWAGARAAGAPVSVVLKMGGSISGRVIEAVRDLSADMVVMASHNPRMSDFLIGSNAAHVALHVPCSVMVVR